MIRLARGSLPWPTLPASVQSKPVCRGSHMVVQSHEMVMHVGQREANFAQE